MDLQLLPPGLKGQFTEKISYGNEEIWAEITQTRLYTNAYIVKDGKVWLVILSFYDASMFPVTAHTHSR